MIVATARAVRSMLRPPPAGAAPPTSTARYVAAPRRGIAPLADLYLPARATGASVVLVHGGGFVIGSRRMPAMRRIAGALTAAGVAACAIDYRMIFRGGRLDDALDDVTAALAWWRGRVSAHALDPARVSLLGVSAGGALAMLAAARCAPGTLDRLIGVFGLYAMDHLGGAAALLPRLLHRTPDRAVWDARCALHGELPRVPTLLLHGAADRLVPVDQAHRLAARRDALGLPTRLVTYPEAPHGYLNQPCPAATDSLAEIVAFVTR